MNLIKAARSRRLPVAEGGKVDTSIEVGKGMFLKRPDTGYDPDGYDPD